MSEHRVPMLGASWRRSEDPAVSRDPRIRAVVGALAALPSPEPNAAFRAELRAQLVAIAPRIVAESAQAAAPTLTERPRTGKPATAPPKHATGVLARLRGVSLRRPLAIAASIITVFALLLGGAVWLSQKALPGDTLYGLKRASESVQLYLDGSSTDKAKDYLRFAARRVDEAQALAQRASAAAMGTGPQAGVIDAHTADLIASTLGSSDSDVKDAAALLTKQAVESSSRVPLKILTDWAPGQLARLAALAAAVPKGALRQRAQTSAWLVSSAANRAKALVPTVAKGCATTSNADSLGVLPSRCGAGPTTAAPRPSKHRNKPQHTGSTSVGATNGPSVGPATVGNPPSSAPEPTGTTSTPPIQLPTLPTIPLPSKSIRLPTKSLPVSVSTCGLGVTLGPIGVNLGGCPSP